MLLLGGALVPLSVYPEWLARFCRALPFRHLVAGPASLFVGQDARAWASLSSLQLACGGCVALVAYALYQLGLRRMVAQGG
jgi:ABC-2 type transport system permease protein